MMFLLLILLSLSTQNYPQERFESSCNRRARDLPHHPILGYPDDAGDYQEYTFSQLRDFSLRAAAYYAKLIPLRRSPRDPEQVVGLLGLSNLEYVATTLALSHLGFTVLFLSTRLAEPAYLSLLNETGCRYMVAGSRFKAITGELQKSLSDLKVFDIIDQLGYKSDDEALDPLKKPANADLDEETKRICWIIHSSGSTGPPKPIYQTHHAALRNYEQNMGMEGFITLPLFHSHGLSSVFRAFTSCKIIYMHSANLPLTAPNLLYILGKRQFEIFYGVPYALKLLSESAEGIDALAAMKTVMFGGSACPDALGDQLVAAGVNLVSHYGNTESGQLALSFRPQGDHAWNYIRINDKVRPFLRWEERGGNLFELIVLDGWPSKVASNRPDKSYATKDLFEPHPTITDAWKYIARLDDTIVLMNGEKAIPIAMEQGIRRSDLVREAVCFGAGRSQLGMIIIKSYAAENMSSEDFMNTIWPTVASQNQSLPGYAQISRDALRVLSATTSFPQTDKGTVIRQAFYRAFTKQIDAVYEDLESNTAGTLVLTTEELKTFLRAELLTLIPPSQRPDDFSDDTDLFSFGVDSLQSTQLRGTIMKKIQLNNRALPPNVVFENPTISKLANHIIGIRDGIALNKVDVAAEMEALIATYSKFKQHVPQARIAPTNAVVVTGATGSLGAHIVTQLAERKDIDEVICLVRASSDQSALGRVEKSLAERKLDTLSQAVKSKITAYSSDLSKSDLGLSPATYTSLLHKTTAIVASAWSVNFNKSLSSFESDCIAGTHNLITVCLSTISPTPASFNFCSSVSTVVNSPTAPVIPEALPPTLTSAQFMGYAQSKLVTEHIVSHAATGTGMAARVLRIGQIIGDTKHGIWNPTEAIPLMLRSATAESTVGALPTLDERPRWLPVDTVATTVIDISLPPSPPPRGTSSSSSVATDLPRTTTTTTTPSSPASNPTRAPHAVVYNVVNPHTFHWTRDLLPALRAAGLPAFKPVTARAWVRLLAASSPDLDRNPTYKLLAFFRAKYGGEEGVEDKEETETLVSPAEKAGKRDLQYVTANAEGASAALASAAVLDQGAVDGFVRYLRGVWGT